MVLKEMSDICNEDSSINIWEYKIVCVNLKEALKKGKPSPYDWNRKNQSEYVSFPHGRFYQKYHYWQTMTLL